MSSERVLSIIPNVTLKAGFMGFKSRQHVLVLSDRRLVFARTTSAMMKQVVSEAREEAKARGGGLLGQWGTQLGAYATFADRYIAMSPDEALAQTDGNFALDRSAITKVSIKVGHVFGDDANTTDCLVIKTTGKKYELTLGSGVSQAKEALTAAGLL